MVLFCLVLCYDAEIVGDLCEYLLVIYCSFRFWWAFLVV